MTNVTPEQILRTVLTEFVNMVNAHQPNLPLRSMTIAILGEWQTMASVLGVAQKAYDDWCVEQGYVDAKETTHNGN